MTNSTLLEALDAGLRLSGRRFDERRELSVRTKNTSVRVSFGETLVLGSLQANKSMPWPDKPSEGMLAISCHFGRCATLPGVARAVGRGEQVAVLVDRLLKGSNAVDLSSLCLLTGKSVWNLRIFLHVVFDQGNVSDAACLCALAVLAAFRRTQAAADEVAPLIHQPLLVSHCVVPTAAKRLVLLADPSQDEEAAASTVVTVGCNATGDVCLVNKCGGVAVPPRFIAECIRQSQKAVIEYYRALPAGVPHTSGAGTPAAVN